MIPIHELLARIRWDPEFGNGKFELAYEDKIEHQHKRVPLERIIIEPGQHFAFEAEEEDGTFHTVPFHRVRKVWRDGMIIWERHPGSKTK
jgi:uncharacterized protein (UPF0248 family)